MKNRKTNSTKLFLYRICGIATIIFVPVVSSSMEIVFEKEYSIIQKEKKSELIWKSITFTKTPAGKIEYDLKVYHPKGLELGYLDGKDSLISKEIKEHLIRKYDLSKSEVEFDKKNRIASIKFILPYDFKTRYIPLKIKRENGFEEYIVRMRFGDYRFMMANRVINNVTFFKPETAVAESGPEEFYEKRLKLSKRQSKEIEKKTPSVAVDEIYDDIRKDLNIESKVSEDLVREDGTVVESKELSIFDEFESLSKQLDPKATESDVASELQPDGAIEDLTQVQDDQVRLVTEDGEVLNQAKKNVPSTLPGKKGETKDLALSEVDAAEEKDFVAPDDVVFDKENIQLEDVVETTVTEFDENMDADLDSLIGDNNFVVMTESFEKDLSLKGVDYDPNSVLVKSLVAQKIMADDDGFDSMDVSLSDLNLKNADENGSDRQPAEAVESLELEDVYGVAPQVWNFDYKEGFVFNFSNKSTETKKTDRSTSSENSIDDLDALPAMKEDDIEIDLESNESLEIEEEEEEEEVIVEPSAAFKTEVESFEEVQEAPLSLALAPVEPKKKD